MESVTEHRRILKLRWPGSLEASLTEGFSRHFIEILGACYRASTDFVVILADMDRLHELTMHYGIKEGFNLRSIIEHLGSSFSCKVLCLTTSCSMEWHREASLYFSAGLPPSGRYFGVSGHALVADELRGYCPKGARISVVTNESGPRLAPSATNITSSIASFEQHLGYDLNYSSVAAKSGSSTVLSDRLRAELLASSASPAQLTLLIAALLAGLHWRPSGIRQEDELQVGFLQVIQRLASGLWRRAQGRNRTVQAAGLPLFGAG